MLHDVLHGLCHYRLVGTGVVVVVLDKFLADPPVFRLRCL